MIINKNQIVKQQLSIVNEMLKHLNDWDSDGDGIIYIDVELAPNLETLKTLLPLSYGTYIKEYGTGVNEDYSQGSIDMSVLVWAELSWGGKDIWYSAKRNKFYVAHIYHYIAHNFRGIKRSIRHKIRSIKCRRDNRKYCKKRRREQKRD